VLSIFAHEAAGAAAHPAFPAPSVVEGPCFARPGRCWRREIAKLWLFEKLSRKSDDLHARHVFDVVRSAGPSGREFSLDHDAIKLNRIMNSFSLFERDLRANAFAFVARENRFPLFRITL
jgi:hypothetical protein